jgi:hypothetical protein
MVGVAGMVTMGASMTGGAGSSIDGLHGSDVATA